MGLLCLWTAVLLQSPAQPLWLPGVDVAADARSALVEQPCSRVSRLVRQHYRAAVGVRVDGATLVSTRPTDGWTRATLVSEGNHCRVRITPLFRLETHVVDGATPGPVTLVIHRHEGASLQARDMDHLQRRNPFPR
jgi:hypothetical protein